MPAIQTDALGRITGGFFGALRAPPNIPLSKFAERNIRLSETMTATPGRMKLLPYQREMLDEMTDPSIERVTFKKSARLGMSTVINAAIAHFVDNDPSPILCVLPRESDARTMAVALEHMFDASPSLAGRLSYVRNDSENRSNLLTRYFPGGSLRLVGANAPANLRAVTARVLFADEVSAFTPTVEGDPMALATMRTASFPNRLIVACSTPTNELDCGVTALYEQSDKRVWEVPCQHCGEFWQIMWSDIRWDDGDPDSAHAVCPSCGGVHFDDEHKLSMVSRGRWRATAPEVKGHAGFHINSLASLLPSARWPTLVREWLKAKSDSLLLQAFVNTVLGEVWREATEGDIDPTSLEARREAFDEDGLPAEVLALTAGVDVQRDRLERTIVGHCENSTPCIIDHCIFWGDPLQDEVWIDLQDDLRRSFPHPGGGSLPIMGASIDAGDGVTMDAAVSFAAPHWRRNWFAIKGVGGTNRTPFDLPRKSKGRAKLAIVGVDTVKTQVIASYGKPPGEAGAMRFSDSLDPDFFDQLTAERRVTRMKAGRPVIAFDQIKKRNEALDCTAYALAIWHFLKPRINWDRQREIVTSVEPVKPKSTGWQDKLSALSNL